MTDFEGKDLKKNFFEVNSKKKKKKTANLLKEGQYNVILTKCRNNFCTKEILPWHSLPI